MSRSKILGYGVLCTMALSGCVTINIYFPAAAAEQAADRIIDEVWQLKNGAAPSKSAPATTREQP